MTHVPTVGNVEDFAVSDRVRKKLALFKFKCDFCIVKEGEHVLRVKNVFFQCSREHYYIL